MKPWSPLLLGLAALLLAACASDSTPAASGGRFGTAPPVPRPKPGTASPPTRATIQVMSGETLADVAARAGVSTRDLIEANGLSPPFKVQAGQVLVLPAPRVHVVKAGDTVSALARRYGLSVSAIVKLNHLQPPYVIKIGDSLTLPAGGLAPAPKLAAAPEVRAEPLPRNEPPPPQIAVAPLVSPPPPSASVPPSNAPAPRGAAGIEASSLPPAKPADVAATETTSRASAPPNREPVKDEAPQAPPPQATPQQASPQQAAPRPAEAQVAALPAPAASERGQPKLSWPVQSGEVISRYGPKPSGLHNDGINIAAREGTPVLAVAEGTVAYAGNELKGFGNLILIRHANGWMSAYAHNATLLVARGDQVRRGQPVGKIGTTGDVDRPQLHFELRHETEAVDPLRYLPRLGNRPRLS